MTKERVQLVEVGLRDGLQSEQMIISTGDKLDLIRRFLRAGIKAVQITSFVHPIRIPQMADAEQLFSSLDADERRFCSALVLNRKGVERAMASQACQIDLSLSASRTHSLKNTGLEQSVALAFIRDSVQAIKQKGIQVRIGVQCAFGCEFEGGIAEDRLLELVSELASLKPDFLCLADSAGMASPRLVSRRVEQASKVLGTIPVILHLHDTRGMGMANLMAGLNAGIRHFDTSFGGLGGCPFIPGASGNLSTEDAHFLLHLEGFDTGIDIEEVAASSRELEKLLGKHLPGKMHRLRLPSILREEVWDRR